MRPYKVAYEHPTQLLASTFLRALAEDVGAVEVPQEAFLAVLNIGEGKR